MARGDFQLGASGQKQAIRAATVVIPTLREAANIGPLLDRIEGAARVSGIALEVIIVDDDSGDGIERMVGKRARVITRKGERGLATAALAGARVARHDTVIIMDGDLSHPPEAIPALLADLDKGAEIAIGSRFCRGGSTDAAWTLSRRVNSALATCMARPFTRLHDPMSGFVAFRKKLIDQSGLGVGSKLPGYKVALELIVRSRAERIAEVPIVFTERVRGESKLTMGVRLDYLRQIARLAWFRFRWSMLAIAALWVLVLLTFGGVRAHEWLDYDDRFHVLENPHFRSLGIESLAGIWREQYGNLYIPVAYTFWGGLAWLVRGWTGAVDTGVLSPAAFQCVKLALHALNATLVFLILRTLGARVWGTLLGAAVFAFHPLQVESVAWISETRGLLAALFGLSAAWFYLRWSRGVAGWLGYALALLLFALALLSKPSAITLPVMIGVIDVFVVRRSVRTAVVALAPFGLLAAAALWLTRALQPGTGAAEVGVLWWQRPLIAGDALAFYFGKFGWPLAMTPDYGRTPGFVLGQTGAWPSFAWLIPALALVVVVYWAWREKWGGLGRVVLGGFGVFVGALLPVLGLVPFDHQEISTVADRYMYLAMLGPAIIVAFAVAVTPRWGGEARRAGWERVIGGMCVLAIGLLAMRSHDQVRHWRNDLTLWSHSLEVSPKSATTLTNLGYALANRGRNEEAIQLYKRSIDAGPNLALARINLAWSTMDVGRFSDAMELFDDAVQRAPQASRAWVGRGILFSRIGRHADALASFRKAAEVNPNDSDAHGNLALSLFEAGDLAAASKHFARSLELRPGFAPTWFNFGLMLEAQGKTEEARAAWERALTLQPDLAPAREGIERLRGAKKGG